jgi:hypothetical protein
MGRGQYHNSRRFHCSRMAELRLASVTFAAILGRSYLRGGAGCPGFPLDNFGFSLQPIVECVPFFSSALFVQFVRTSADLFLHVSDGPRPWVYQRW